MIAPVIQNITLDEFLTLGNVDDSPAWEYVNGTVMRKPMPKLRHAIIQKRLLSEIDAHTQVFTALPELRCTFGNRSIVPDIAVIAWERLGISSRGQFDDELPVISGIELSLTPARIMAWLRK